MKVEPLGGLLDGDRALDAAGGAREGGHHPVAEPFDDSPAVGLDGVVDGLDVSPTQLLRILVTQAGQPLGRADDVGEADGQRCPTH